MADPSLPKERREQLISDLMAARRAVGKAMRDRDDAGETAARAAVDKAKRALGERGPVWWADGSSDLNRHLARTTIYSEWFEQLGRAVEPSATSRQLDLRTGDGTGSRDRQV